MGPGGLLTRILPERFGSAFTFAPVRRDRATAPGQITAGEIEHMRAGRGARPRLLGIAGGPGALGSHGLSVYNRIFAARKLNLIYVPFITASLRASLPLLGRLGFAGLSVTQPLKQEAFSLCDRAAPEAAEAGAVNTLVFRRGRIVGYNTDCLAAVKILEGVRARTGRRIPGIAIAGAGGAARAVSAAAARLGWQGCIYNRTPERAEALAGRFGFDCRPLHTLESDLADFDVLVNCTSVGMDSRESILGGARVLKGKTVIDLVSHPRRTRLMAQAERAGARTIPGTRFWALQGHYQMKILASVTLSLKSIENQLRYSEYPGSKRI
jgi:3-dehydroquinate dehydratase/shikimate dehydrogenase